MMVLKQGIWTVDELAEVQERFVKGYVERGEPLNPTLWMVRDNKFIMAAGPMPIQNDPMGSAIIAVKTVKPDIFAYVAEGWMAIVGSKEDVQNYKHGDIAARPDRVEALALIAKERQGKAIVKIWTTDRAQRTVKEITMPGMKITSRLDVDW
jgi:hypothetical protein